MFGNIKWSDADNVRGQITEIPNMVTYAKQFISMVKKYLTLQSLLLKF